MGTLRRIAPIFPVRDLDVSLAHYQRLGFATRRYEGGGYGFATRDGVEIHLGVVPTVDAHTSAGSAYLWVDDADALAQEWRDAGAVVRSRRHCVGTARRCAHRPRPQRDPLRLTDERLELVVSR